MMFILALTFALALGMEEMTPNEIVAAAIAELGFHSCTCVVMKQKCGVLDTVFNARVEGADHCAEECADQLSGVAPTPPTAACSKWYIGSGCVDELLNQDGEPVEVCLPLDGTCAQHPLTGQFINMSAHEKCRDSECTDCEPIGDANGDEDGTHGCDGDVPTCVDVATVYSYHSLMVTCPVESCSSAPAGGNGGAAGGNGGTTEGNGGADSGNGDSSAGNGGAGAGTGGEGEQGGEGQASGNTERRKL